MPAAMHPATWRWDRRRAVLLALAAVLVLLLPAAGAVAPTTAPAPGGVVGPELAQLAAAHPERVVEVVVQAGGVEAGRAAVRAAGGTPTRDLRLIGAVVARMPAKAARALALEPGVRAVSLNAAVERSSLDPALLRTSFNQSVRSDRTWAAGWTGRGVGVAVIDTGVQGDVPDFRVSASDRRSRVVATAITNPEATGGGDTFGHGTHVAGIIAGNGNARDASDAIRGRYAGVAPEAHLVAVKVDDGSGHATLADVIDGLQFVVDHKDAYGIRVVNLSLRSTEAQSYLVDPLDAAVEQAWFAGIVVVAAAGNGGTGADAVSYAPANDPFVITVGGVDDKGTKDIADDQLAPWSSRGRTQDGFQKPEVVAPGARIASTMAPRALYRELCPGCIVDESYFRVGGTSMAAAVVSGEVALLLQAQPHMTPDQVKATIVKRTRAVIEATSSTGELVDGQGVPQPATVTSTTTVTGAEVAADKAINNPTSDRANVGIVPSPLLDQTTRLIDWSRMGWSRMGWSQAADGLRAGWSGATWTPSAWSRMGWSATETSCADLARAGWSRMGWSSEELAAAQEQCQAIDPTRMGWSRMGWSRMGWSTSFDR